MTMKSPLRERKSASAAALQHLQQQQQSGVPKTIAIEIGGADYSPESSDSESTNETFPTYLSTLTPSLDPEEQLTPSAADPQQTNLYHHHQLQHYPLQRSSSLLQVQVHTPNHKSHSHAHSPLKSSSQHRAKNVIPLARQLFLDNYWTRPVQELQLKINASPRIKAALKIASDVISALPPWLGLLGTPLIPVNGSIPEHTTYWYLFQDVWTGLMSMQFWIVALMSIVVAFYYASTEEAAAAQKGGGKTVKHHHHHKNSSQQQHHGGSCGGGSSKKSKSSSSKYYKSSSSWRHHQQHPRHQTSSSSSSLFSLLLPPRIIHCVLYSRSMRFYRLAFLLVALIVNITGIIIAPLSLAFPSWIWHPLAYFSPNFQIVTPTQLEPALRSLCIDQDNNNLDNHDPLFVMHNDDDIHQPRSSSSQHSSLRNNPKENPPLCLSEEQWVTLSTGALTSQSPHDVQAVLQGVQYAQNTSGGIVIAILARDIIGFMEALKENVEALVPFFSNVAVVVFENDSQDGSREAFQKWSQEQQEQQQRRLSKGKGYTVDLLDCEDAVDCRFGKKHRDQVDNYSYSSAIGDMHIYRQRIVDHVLTDSKYQGYSHMMVLDPDLGVSLSPLGVLHTLGRMPDRAVASVGRQPFATSYGSLVIPYDFSAFLPLETKHNERMVAFHKRFCHLMPFGNRWANECDVIDPFYMVQMLAHDHDLVNLEDEAYSSFIPVRSAFNGAVLYPISLIRDSHAKYDSGPDGQRCEHKGFHLAMNQMSQQQHQHHQLPQHQGGGAAVFSEDEQQDDSSSSESESEPLYMYMNRKWDMHIRPTHPGGPHGPRSLQPSQRIIFIPRLFSSIMFLHHIFHCIFVWSVMTLAVTYVYPLWKYLFQPKHQQLQQQQPHQYPNRKSAAYRRRQSVPPGKLV